MNLKKIMDALKAEDYVKLRAKFVKLLPDVKKAFSYVDDLIKEHGEKEISDFGIDRGSDFVQIFYETRPQVTAAIRLAKKKGVRAEEGGDFSVKFYNKKEDSKVKDSVDIESLVREDNSDNIVRLFKDKGKEVQIEGLAEPFKAIRWQNYTLCYAFEKEYWKADTDGVSDLFEKKGYNFIEQSNQSGKFMWDLWKDPK